MTGERWRAVAGYEGHYEVSDAGLVRSLPRTVPFKGEFTRRVAGGIRKPVVGANGYPTVILKRAGRRRTACVHVLVLEAFAGPRPEGYEGCHNNGNPLDNRIENLRWDSKRENRIDIVRHGRSANKNKSRCKYGHELSEVNNTGWARRSGWRACLACSRSRSHLHNHPEETLDHQAISDRYYEAITRKETTHHG